MSSSISLLLIFVCTCASLASAALSPPALLNGHLDCSKAAAFALTVQTAGRAFYTDVSKTFDVDYVGNFLDPAVEATLGSEIMHLADIEDRAEKMQAHIGTYFDEAAFFVTYVADSCVGTTAPKVNKLKLSHSLKITHAFGSCATISIPAVTITNQVVEWNFKVEGDTVTLLNIVTEGSLEMENFSASIDAGCRRLLLAGMMGSGMMAEGMGIPRTYRPLLFDVLLSSGGLLVLYAVYRLIHYVVCKKAAKAMDVK